MSDLIFIFGVLGALAATLANVAIWAPRQVRVRLGALVITAVFLPVAYISLAEMLARPKPVEIEWARTHLDEATVLSARMLEGKAIYVWLDIDGVAEPRAYALAWNEQTARQLHGAQRSAQLSGARVRMRKPFERSIDEGEPIFYAPPPLAPPAKQALSESPLAFHRTEETDLNDGPPGATR